MTWVATRTVLRNGQRFEAGDPVDLGDDVAAQAELARLGAIEAVADPVLPDPAPTVDLAPDADAAPAEAAPDPDPAPVEPEAVADPAPAPKGRPRRA